MYWVLSLLLGFLSSKTTEDLLAMTFDVLILFNNVLLFITIFLKEKTVKSEIGARPLIKVRYDEMDLEEKNDSRIIFKFRNKL
mmetsp:Transcript_44532/g.32636  ORF Transcript_44532/g.32636 Transcript_44532/m.32636 type:complete len:83 (+) Transcript_44532:304-552(+)